MAPRPRSSRRAASERLRKPSSCAPSQEGRCRPSRLLAASQLSHPESEKAHVAPPPQSRLAAREAALKRRLSCFADAQGRRRALNLALATLQLWKQNVASRRLLAAQRDAAFYKERLELQCVSTRQQETAARRCAFEAGALAATSRISLQLHCLHAWRALVQSKSREVTAEEYGSLLTAHLEHNERCLRVLEAWAIGLEASLVRVCFHAWYNQKPRRSATARAAAAFGRHHDERCLVRVLQRWAQLPMKQCRSALKEAGAKGRRQVVAVVRIWRLEVDIARRSRVLHAAERRAMARWGHAMAAMLSSRGRMLVQLCLLAWRLSHRISRLHRKAIQLAAPAPLRPVLLG
ncbi:NAP1 [Symbiodinium natans]|uniref:NAP1 protein n=1 Tax=Symbiodinium natans TaxID=878477 RepID=A0A812RRC8_9DINO|nr:NAP1 [Symbiodinium natans]